jgi:uncharacterized protein
MKPFYFGEAGRELFGTWYAPRRTGARPAGVVLCPPAPQEAMRLHFAYRKIAAALSRLGLHVLRFDWSGTGDSAGDGGSISLGRWLNDVRIATEELRDVSGATTISLFGASLGASIAQLACGNGLPVHQLVLWDPVVHGRRWLESLFAIRDHHFEWGHVRRTEGDRQRQLLGFVLPDSFRDEIVALDLLGAERGRAAKRALLVTADTAEARALRDRLGTELYEVVADPSGRDALCINADLQSSMLSNVIVEASVAPFANARPPS